MFKQLSTSNFKASHGGRRTKFIPGTKQARAINPGPMRVEPTRTRPSLRGPDRLNINRSSSQTTGAAAVIGGGAVVLAGAAAASDEVAGTHFYSDLIHTEDWLAIRADRQKYITLNQLAGSWNFQGSAFLCTFTPQLQKISDQHIENT